MSIHHRHACEDSPELGLEERRELLSLRWRITATGWGNGREYVDPTTGWSYEVDIEWENGRETTFDITLKHYQEMDARFENAGDDEWFDAPMPEWLQKVLVPENFV